MTGSAKREVHLGLLYHSLDSENLGVGAFTVANCAMLGEAVERHGGSPVFHIIGVRGRKDYRHACPWPSDFTNIGNKSLVTPGSDLRRVLSRCDAFLDIGGGDSFSDIYPSSRYWRLVAVKVLAARTGNPLVLSPQTVGPFTTWWGRIGAKIALRSADRVFARDEMSLAALGELGMQQKSELTTDLAFALPFEKPEKTSPEALAAGGLSVGFNVSGLLHNLDPAGGGRINLSLDYRQLVRRIIERLLADPAVANLHLVPHVSVPELPIDDDGEISRQLLKEYPDLLIAPDFDSPSQAKSFIAGLDLLLGSRMHATIAALSSDTAVLPLGYSRKFDGLFGSLDYPYLVDLRSADEASALAQLDRVLADLPEVAKVARKSNARAQEKLGNYREFVDRFVQDLMRA